eukprot:5652712-Alexandrium_andersonii.AAC.1
MPESAIRGRDVARLLDDVLRRLGDSKLQARVPHACVGARQRAARRRHASSTPALPALERASTPL